MNELFYVVVQLCDMKDDDTKRQCSRSGMRPHMGVWYVSLVWDVVRIITFIGVGVALVL